MVEVLPLEEHNEPLVLKKPLLVLKHQITLTIYQQSLPTNQQKNKC